MKPVFCHEIDAYAIALLDRITLIPQTRNYRPSVPTKDSDRCLVLIQPSTSPGSAPHRVRPIFASVSPQRGLVARSLGRARPLAVQIQRRARHSAVSAPEHRARRTKRRGAQALSSSSEPGLCSEAIMPVKPGSFRPSAGTGGRGRNAPKAPRIETLAKKSRMSLKRSVIRPRV